MKQVTNKSIAPAITLIFLSPLVTEILPGATRFTSIFVFPLEVLVWGGGALLIRYVVRKNNLGWLNMLFFALVLSVAEEFLIQQTSVASLVIRLKGVTYALAGGVNYVYLLWALIYESVSAVLLPVYLSELIYSKRKNDVWINKGGVLLFSILFLVGCLGAWFSWTQIARTKVFHLPAYNPPLSIISIAIIAIIILVFLGMKKFPKKAFPLYSDIPGVGWFIICGAVWSVLLYGLMLLAFGIQPAFSPLAAIAGGMVLAIIPLYFLPRLKAQPEWNNKKTFSVIFGVLIGSMGISFLGFIGSAPKDLYFKIIVDVVAFVLLLALGSRLWKKTEISPEINSQLVME